MRIRESGMPSAEVWESFFKPGQIIDKLGLCADIQDVVEFGCGYGTFTIPAAHIIRGKITVFDLDAGMIEHVKAAAAENGIRNIVYYHDDFGRAVDLLGEESVNYVMLFNILHGEEPQALLTAAYTLLAPGGKAGIIHWNYDPETPRGPPMAIRPHPDNLAKLASKHGFNIGDKIDLPPYHYGFELSKPRA